MRLPLPLPLRRPSCACERPFALCAAWLTRPPAARLVPTRVRPCPRLLAAVAIMLAGVLEDYKESEGFPAEIASHFDSM